MNKGILSVAAILLCFVTASAQKGKVVIDASIRDMQADSMVYWTSVSSTHDDSVKTVNGGFHIEIPIRPGEGNMYIIQIGEKYSDIARKVFYLELGHVVISGNGPKFKDVILSGSLFMQDYNNYLELLAKNSELAGENDLYAKHEELAKKNDTIALAALELKMNKVRSIRIALSRDWIRLHPSSPISTFILYTVLKNSLKMNQLDSMLSRLSPGAKNNLIAKSMSNSIKVDQETWIGQSAFEFTQKDTSGIPVSLSDFKGKYVLLDFWASWCSPCRLENPIVVAAYKKFQAKNFSVISISLDQQEERNRWINAIHQDGLIWTNLSDLQGWNNAVAKLYDIQAVPSNFLIDPSGIIIAKNLRGDDLDKKLSEIMGN